MAGSIADIPLEVIATVGGMALGALFIVFLILVVCLEERRKMTQWVKLGGYSLILWWAVIGGLFMTYLYSVAGLAYLNAQFQQTGSIPSGVEVPIPVRKP